MSEICAGCCSSFDWLQQSHTEHKKGPVLSFPHASPVVAPQSSNALWCGFELACRESSTKSCQFAVAWCVAVAVAYMSVVAFSLILSEDRGVSLSSQDGDDLTLKTAVSLSPQDRNDLTLITGQG